MANVINENTDNNNITDTNNLFQNLNLDDPNDIQKIFKLFAISFISTDNLTTAMHLYSSYLAYDTPTNKYVSQCKLKFLEYFNSNYIRFLHERDFAMLNAPILAAVFVDQINFEKEYIKINEIIKKWLGNFEHN